MTRPTLNFAKLLNRVHQGHASLCRERSWNLGRIITRSIPAKITVFMSQPDSGRDLHISPLLHSTDCQSSDRTQLEAMSARPYNPLRSAIILAIAFLLPLLLSVYSDRLTDFYASLWSPSANSAAAIRYNDTTIQADSILAQQQTVRSPYSMSISVYQTD